MKLFMDHNLFSSLVVFFFAPALFIFIAYIFDLSKVFRGEEVSTPLPGENTSA